MTVRAELRQLAADCWHEFVANIPAGLRIAVDMRLFFLGGGSMAAYYEPWGWNACFGFGLFAVLSLADWCWLFRWWPRNP
jgi:hypothetical protein